MIIGNAVKHKTEKSRILKNKKTIILRLSILNDIDFNEKKGRLLFIKIHEIIIITKKVFSDSNKYLKSINNGFSINNGKLTIKRALTGAGSPLNSVLLSISMLNLAKRIDVARVIKKPAKPSGTKDMLYSFSKSLKIKFLS